MAITKAREDFPADQPSLTVYTGDGQVNTADNIGGAENSRIKDEGVVTRSKEDEEKLVKEADEFMKSKVEFDKVLEESKKQVSKGKINTPIQKKLADQEEKDKKDADKKATAPGANPADLNTPIGLRTAEQTKKLEAADVVKADASKAQAQGNVSDGEKKKEEAKKLEEQGKK
jgi:hypothetical protein